MSGGDWKDMYAAALAGDLALVRYHIAAGVNPNYQHPEILCTPLVASLIHGHDDVARYLIANGADPQLRSDFDDLPPLQAARRYQRTELVALLQARDAQDERKPFWWRWLPV